MDFDLTYSGRLPGSSSHQPQNLFKNQLRLHFHEQLVALSGRPDMFEGIQNMTETKMKGNLMIEVPDKIYRRQGYDYVRGHNYVVFCGSRYVPMITRGKGLVCRLEMTLHRREKPGGIISGADIDNRLKVIFDALRIPHSESEAGEAMDRPDPFYCLLEDDQLISDLSVSTRELLRPPTESEKDDHAQLTIHVAVKFAN